MKLWPCSVVTPLHASRYIVLGIPTAAAIVANAFPFQFSSTAKGVASLLQLLYSTHEDVVYKATWALSICARSPAVAEAICRMG